MQSNKDEYDQVTRNFNASQYTNSYKLNDFTKSETY
mgnify:CR=1 FL=1